MRRILAIAFLTLRAAIRYRLVLVLGALLIGGVVALPLVIKHDGTARGFTQILLTYTLSLITMCLGFATIWLACGTLAREIEEAQVQMLVVKPIARWQIWLGKWFGIMALNALLLTIAGIAVYAMLLYRAGTLSPKEQAVLRDEVLIARASAKEPIPDYQGDAEKIFREGMTTQKLRDGVDPKMARQMVVERVKAEYQLVRPGYMRQWTIDLGDAADFVGKPLYIRAKFNSPETQQGAAYPAQWEVGAQTSASLYRTNFVMVPDSFSQFQVPPNLLDEKGVLNVRFINMSQSALLFPLDEGMEVLYREGGFGLNFIRGMVIIFFWTALLAAAGLAASSLLSFPVAAFCTIGLLIITFSTGTLKQIVDEGGFTGTDTNTGLTANPSFVDASGVALARAILFVLNLARGFSPIDSLSEGRSVSWSELARAFFQIILEMGGILAAFGIFIFSRRELATAQGKS